MKGGRFEHGGGGAGEDVVWEQGCGWGVDKVVCNDNNLKKHSEKEEPSGLSSMQSFLQRDI